MFFRSASRLPNTSLTVTEALAQRPQRMTSVKRVPPSSEHATVETLARMSTVPIVSLVEAILEHAYHERASDIHIEPRDTHVLVRLRIDGMLRDAHTVPSRILAEVISRIKVLSNLRTDEHHAAQDGRFKLSLSKTSTIDVRVSITPTYFGENAVLRILRQTHTDQSLELLGFSEYNVSLIRRALERPYGMILATGPTGSGKTTTLYTLAGMRNTKDVSIITIEDPIEYAIPGITQIQINPRTGLTFAHGLRSILRQDPNIIMVGEIRDKETASIAVNTALTGHILLSTLHTSSAAATLPRLLEMDIDSYLVASTVTIAIGQRLLRRICPSCSTPHPLTDSERENICETLNRRVHIPYEKMRTDFMRGTGCRSCDGSGYKGRIGIHEVLVVNAEVRDAILRKASIAELHTIAIKSGMVSMGEDAYQKAQSHITTIEEVLRVIRE
jgi:type IV pilus assembly protein PilB